MTADGDAPSDGEGQMTPEQAAIIALSDRLDALQAEIARLRMNTTASGHPRRLRVVNGSRV